MAEPSITTEDFKMTSLWWEDAPPQPADNDVPADVDVAIVGSGYAGMMAALTLGRGGLSVVVLDAENPGYGAATRNHGHAGGIGKLPSHLDRSYDAETASLIKDDAKLAREYMLDFVRNEVQDVDFVGKGRFLGAHSPSAYDALARNLEHYRKNLGLTVEMVPRAEQHREIGSDYYFGGITTEEAASLHPAKLHREMRRLAEAAGVVMCGRAAVVGMERQGKRHVLRTVRGDVACDRVVIATNGYSGPLSPSIQRSLVPVPAYMIATEPLPKDLIDEVLPTWRSGGDTKRAVFAYRRSPDGTRMIFAGRASFHQLEPKIGARRLHSLMCTVWPQLKQAKVSHCWTGMLAFTPNGLPHVGEEDGVHYVAGCNSSGIVMMSYLGRQVGLKLLHARNRALGVERIPFKRIPLYNGRPWFLPWVGRYYVLRDSLDRLGAR